MHAGHCSRQRLVSVIGCHDVPHGAAVVRERQRETIYFQFYFWSLEGSASVSRASENGSQFESGRDPQRKQALSEPPKRSPVSRQSFVSKMPRAARAVAAGALAVLSGVWAAGERENVWAGLIDLHHRALAIEVILLGGANNAHEPHRTLQRVCDPGF